MMSSLGYSINTLTLFGMVLAIGLLVDDAIVVVENVGRLIQEEHLSPKEAARKSMDEISGALIGIGMVLSAVFLPMAFFGGSTGVIYRQFSITIVSSRSEEHKSELQSLMRISYAVFCLKKKNTLSAYSYHYQPK